MSEAIFRRNASQWTKKTTADNAAYLHVIGAGLPRTGTSSLKAALEILGFGPCHHMSEVFDKPDRATQFIRAYNGENVDFFQLMKGYGSTVDVPTTDFYKEIYQAYPKAKVVLTVRESDEKWFESFQNSVAVFSIDNTYYFAVYLIRFLRLQCIVARVFWKKWINEFGPIGPKFHSYHNAKVISENKEGDVLVFNVKEGWPPLCKFLGVDVPQNTPFPNVNDTKDIKRLISLARTMGWCLWILVGVVIVAAVYAIIKFAM
jgi:hypothetical protein